MSIDIVAGMKCFTAVVDAGSFAKAAEKLDLSRGMATRYVAQLEAHLGARLLNRTTRKLSLTETGSDYYERAVQVLAMIEEAETSAAQESAIARGTLRVNTSVAFGTGHMASAITEFLRLHPGVTVSLTLNDRVVDLVEEGFDIAVRIGAKIDPGLIARRLTPARIILCASPGYLENYGIPKTPDELVHHNCLNYDYSSPHGQWRFRKKGSERMVRVTGNLHGNNGNAIVNAAIEGLGIALQPTFLVYEAVKTKKLVRLLADWETNELSVYAVYPSRRFLPPKVRLFIDFLAARFGTEPYWDAALKPRRKS